MAKPDIPILKENGHKVINGIYKSETGNGHATKIAFTNGNSIHHAANGKSSTQNVSKPCVYLGEVPGSEIQDFYKGKTVFITGVTGFVGKVLLERLLVSCPGIDKIYMMIREKKGHSVSTRMTKLFQAPLFAHIDEETISKVHPVVGDVGLSDLGMSNEDYQMLADQVHIVIHCAAIVRFDASLSELIKINVKGTCDVVELSRKMKKLVSFVYVSTIYSNYREDVNEELVYPPGIDLDVAVGFENMDQENLIALEILSEKILQSWPNMYSFSKCLSENAVKERGRGLPICVFRPAVVAATSHEHPVPGYVDNLNGGVGMMIATGMGVWRLIVGNTHNSSTMLPSDYCANAIIACSWKTANERTLEPKVYNYVPTDKLGWSVSQVVENTYIHARTEPFDRIYGYPYAIVVKSLTVARILAILMYFIPGLFADGFRRLAGKKPKIVKNYRRFIKHLEFGYKFVTLTFNFRIRNTKNLVRSLNDVDSKIFKMNLDEYSIPLNYPVMMKGVKQYLLKENPEASIEARNKLRRHKIYFYMWIYSTVAAVVGFFLLFLHIFVF